MAQLMGFSANETKPLKADSVDSESEFDESLPESSLVRTCSKSEAIPSVNSVSFFI